MILGVGTDILKTARMEKALGIPSFSGRSFTEEEQRQAKGKVSFFAGCFTVKEAVAKCFGTGFRGFGPADIEVLRDGQGKPYVNLYGGAKRIFDEMHAVRISVSVSDTDDTVIAFAVLEG